MKDKTSEPTSIERLTIWIGSPASLAVHTIAFSSAFLVALLGLAPWDSVLLVVTTIVSLEAIYLAIFIQMSVNRAERSLQEVEEDVAGIEEDITTIEESIDDISEDIEGIEKDVAEIEENIDEVSEDIEELQEDIDEMSEEEDKDGLRKQRQEITLGEITETLHKLINEIDSLKKQNHTKP